MIVHFTCKACSRGFDTEWLFGDDVQCTRCGTTFKTDYDTDSEDNIIGPWLTEKSTKEQ